MPKDGMERGGTGGRVGAAAGLRDPCAIMASPFGTSALAARTTPYRTARQCDDGGSRMAFTTRLANVRDPSKHCNERTRMCYGSTVGEGWGSRGDAGPAKPHLEHNPLSLLGTGHATPIRKLNDPARQVRVLDTKRNITYTMRCAMLSFRAGNEGLTMTTQQKFSDLYLLESEPDKRRTPLRHTGGGNCGAQHWDYWSSKSC